LSRARTAIVALTGFDALVRRTNTRPETIQVHVALIRLFAGGRIDITHLSTGTGHAGTTIDTHLPNTGSPSITIADITTTRTFFAQPSITNPCAGTVHIFDASIRAFTLDAHALV